MGVLTELIVAVGANIEGFKRGMKEVDDKVGKTSSGFGGLGAGILGVGAIAATAVTGLVAFGVSAVDATTNAGQAAFQMSERFGLATDTASAWLTVARHLGVDSDMLGAGFKFLAKNVEAIKLHFDETGKHSKALSLGFRELGISTFNSNGTMKTANELMLESADAFARMPDGMEKTALAVKLFGKQGMEMLPVLNLGRKGIEDMMKAGKANGEVMSKDQVAAAHAMFLEQQKLNSAWTGITMTLGSFLMPIMQKVFDFILNTAIPVVRQLAQYFREHIYPALVQVGSAFMQLIGPAIAYIKDHFDQLKPVLMAVAITVGIMVGLVVVGIGLVVLAVIGLVAGITWLSGEFKSLTTKWAADTQNFIINAVRAFRGLVDFFKALPGNIYNAARGMWDALWTEFKGILNKIIAAWNGLHFTIGGGNFAGQNIPSTTLTVPQIPYFHQGGLVPGTGDMLAVLQGGERVLSRREASGAAAMAPQIHIHIDQGAYIDGPSVDRLANVIAQRLSYVTGR